MFALLNRIHTLGDGDPTQCKAKPHGNCKRPQEKASYRKVEDLTTNSASVSPVKAEFDMPKGPPFLAQSKGMLEEIKRKLIKSKDDAPSQILA